MTLHSLRARLVGLWILALLACSSVGILLLQLSHQSTAAQIERAQAVVARACDLIAERWQFYASDWAGPSKGQFDKRLRAELNGVVWMALAHERGVEGGLWQAEKGSLAYAYPTYQGDGPKTDLPAAELKRIGAINRQAAQDEQPVDRSYPAASETLLLHACALSGPVNGLTAWTMTRVHSLDGLGPLRLGLTVLLALVIAMTVWLGRILIVWASHIRSIRTSLAAAGAGGMPVLAKTGERELDDVIAALNDAGRRLAAARRQADEAAARASRAERLASLGRVAAGVAHEIRNPIAAAILQGENALAGDDARRRESIAEMLGALARLDKLVTDLLAMTQRVEPRPRAVDLAGFLAERVAAIQATANAKAVAVKVRAAGDATLDPAVVARIVDNLLTNAVRHTPPGGTVAIRAERTPGRLTLSVADSGTGVAPDLAPHLFEPFVTGRADGTGLGLAIARELAGAHGGSLDLGAAPSGAGACGAGPWGARGAVFTLVLPQPEPAEPCLADSSDRR